MSAKTAGAGRNSRRSAGTIGMEKKSVSNIWMARILRRTTRTLKRIWICTEKSAFWFYISCRSNSFIN